MARPPLHLHLLRRRAAHLAAGRDLAAVPQPVYDLQHVHFDGAVPAVPLPKGRAVSAEGAGRTPRHGHHDRGLPLVDVARTELPVTVPVCRLLLPGVQFVCAVPAELPSGGAVARERAERGVLRAVCGQCGDHVHGHTGEDSAAGQGAVSANDAVAEEGELGTIRLWIHY